MYLLSEQPIVDQFVDKLFHSYFSRVYTSYAILIILVNLGQGSRNSRTEFC